MRTAVAFIIFNRPDCTERVFAEIAKARPSQLFVIADGPRPERPGEVERCAATRRIIEQVDWDCRVLKNYSEANLGCGRRVASGISWVFDHVEEAIILEDDCMPHSTFFPFCEELLDQYRSDPRVMHIAGNNFQFGRKQAPFSYFFSHFTPSWGWASWRRAWQQFDWEGKRWPALRDSPLLLNMLGDHKAVAHWRELFDLCHAGVDNVNTWDYQWNFACFAQNGFAVLPNVTLVSNIGFGPEGTHTKGPNDRMANLPMAEMTFPLRHPPGVVRDQEADRIFIEEMIIPYIPKQASLYHRLRQKCSATLPAPLRKSLSSLRSRLVSS